MGIDRGILCENKAGLNASTYIAMRRRSRALLGGYKRIKTRQSITTYYCKNSISLPFTGFPLSCAFTMFSSTTRSLIQIESLHRSDPIVRASLTGFMQKHLQLMTDKELKEMQDILQLNDKRLKMYLDSGITPPQLRDNATSVTLRQFYRFWIAQGKEYK